MSVEPKIPAAVVLCGGRSHRMGTDKASIKFGVESLLGRACRTALESASCVVVVAACGQLLPPLPSEVIVDRDQFSNAGPLGGLLTGLKRVQCELNDTVFPTASVWVSSCDTPFIDAEFIQALHCQRDCFDVICVESEGRVNPLNAVYSMGCLAVLERLFLAGERRAMALLDAVNTKTVPLSDICNGRAIDFLLNVNTPELLARALVMQSLNEIDDA